MKIFLACLMVFTSFTFGPEAYAKKNRKYKKTVYAKKYKQSKKRNKRIKYIQYKRKALPLLSLQLAGQLHHDQRVRYVKLFREAVFAAEAMMEFQHRRIIKGKKSRKGAQIDSLMKLLLGQDVYAAPKVARVTGGVGFCAANLSTSVGEGYDKVSCATNPAFNCTGQHAGSSSHRACGYLATGLTAENNCVSVKVRGRSILNGATELGCRDRIRQQQDKHWTKHSDGSRKERKDDELKGLLDEYGKLLRGIHKKKGTITDKDDFDERLKVINQLSKYAYDEEVFAHMMKLSADVLKDDPNAKLPGSLSVFGDYNSTVMNFDEATKKGRLEVYSNFNSLTDNLDETWFGIAQTCHAKLPPKVRWGAQNFGYAKDAKGNKILDTKGNPLVVPLETLSNKEKAAQATVYHDEMRNNYDSCRAAGDNARQKDCYLRNECKLFFDRGDGRFDKIFDVYQRIYSDMKDVSNSLPVTLKGRIPAVTTFQDEKDLKGKRLLGKDRFPEIAADSFGCERFMRQDKNLAPSAMACMACSFERDKVIRNELDNKPRGYKISTKWLALLEVGARLCGDSVDDSGKYVRIEKAIQYAQTYGHCGKDVYDWEPGQSNAEAELFQNFDADQWISRAGKSDEENELVREEINDFFKRRDVRGNKAENGISEDESVSDYLNRKFEAVFGLPLQGETKGFLFTYKKFPGVKNLFCPQANPKVRFPKVPRKDQIGDGEEKGAKMADDISGRRVYFQSAVKGLGKYKKYLEKTPPPRRSTVNKWEDEQRHSFRNVPTTNEQKTDKLEKLNPLLSCIQEAQANADELYKVNMKDEYQSDEDYQRSGKLGCYQVRKSMPLATQITLDVPLVSFQDDPSAALTCYTSDSIREKRKSRGKGKGSDYKGSVAMVDPDPDRRKGQKKYPLKATISDKDTMSCSKGNCGKGAQLDKVVTSQCLQDDLRARGYYNYREKPGEEEKAK